jgi:hypothetical protein
MSVEAMLYLLTAIAVGLMVAIIVQLRRIDRMLPKREKPRRAGFWSRVWGR